jgi:magnesium chelatase accessory protein
MPSSIPARVPRDWPHRKTSRSVAIGMLDWHVQVMGSGPTVLLLHGTGSSAHSWADVMPFLADVVTVVVPDLPGHGYTTGASMESLSLTQIAADLDTLLAKLHVKPVTLVAGHSAGAALAICWALVAAKPPRAIVGFNPSLVPPPALYTTLLAPLVNPIATSSALTVWLASLGGRSGLVNSLLDSTRSSIPEAQRACYAKLFSDPAHVRGTMGYMAAADLPGMLEDARKLTIPTHFVLGAQDPWVPERSLRRVIACSFPNALVDIWEGGHLLHETQPERAAQFLKDVLAETPARRG